MLDLVFFYGTLMKGFARPGRTELDGMLKPVGRGWIPAALFDLGIYPAAVPATDTKVWGEVHRISSPDVVLPALDEIEGHSVSEPLTSLYTREEALVTLADGSQVHAWVYFYNAPLGRAERIESGDYLEHLRVRRHL